MYLKQMRGKNIAIISVKKYVIYILYYADFPLSKVNPRVMGNCYTVYIKLYLKTNATRSTFFSHTHEEIHIDLK